MLHYIEIHFLNSINVKTNIIAEIFFLTTVCNKILHSNSPTLQFM
uniref:Macaca fascicularis brain cDNA, clone: QflA-17763 n=1 Tax=Macaca fascicularis TaxID=9541 RepID=I7GBX8_MACFA|nr:unnamed protein product [Macaca fascicularis]